MSFLGFLEREERGSALPCQSSSHSFTHSHHTSLSHNVFAHVCLSVTVSLSLFLRSSYQSIVRDYLVLRHNAQVAKALLVRSQNDSSAARHELQRCLEQIESEAAKHRAHSESIAHAQWAARTRELRAQVVEKEKLLDETAQRVASLRQRKSLDIAALQKEIRRVERLCVARERQRETDVQAAMHELRYLRQSVRSVEERIVALHALPVPLDEQGQREIAEMLRRKLNAMVREAAQAQLDD